MLTLGTPIDQEKLEEQCNFYSDCQDFLYNFFTTCQGYDIGTNLVNYISDIGEYRRTEKWRTTDLELLHAFLEITGYNVERDRKKLN